MAPPLNATTRASSIAVLAVVAVISLINLANFDGDDGKVVEDTRRLDIVDINDGDASTSDASHFVSVSEITAGIFF